MSQPLREGDGYFARPLAPAPLSALVGVVVLTGFLLVGAGRIHNDYLAVTSCVAVLASGAAILDFTGRNRAKEHPNALYRPENLPSEKTKLKPALVALTFLVLLVVVSATARPGKFGSATPYFFAAGFLFLVMPQLLARRVIRKQKRGENGR